MDQRPAGRETVAMILGRLALHDRSRAGWPEARWAALMEDYLDFLAPYPAHALDLGRQIWLRDGKPFFPTVAEFIDAIEVGLREWRG